MAEKKSLYIAWASFRNELHGHVILVQHDIIQMDAGVNTNINHLRLRKLKIGKVERGKTSLQN